MDPLEQEQTATRRKHLKAASHAADASIEILEGGLARLKENVKELIATTKVSAEMNKMESSAVKVAKVKLDHAKFEYYKALEEEKRNPKPETENE